MTGYIAGDALYVLSKAHPEYEYAALVRTKDKADIVQKDYPSVRIVLGGVDDDKILREECSKADVVLREWKTSFDRSCHSDMLQMLRMLPITKVPPNRSKLGCCKGTAKNLPVIGCIPVEQASSLTQIPSEDA